LDTGKTEVDRALFIGFNMEMSSKFPFCVPVAAGIVRVFIINHGKRFAHRKIIVFFIL